MLAALNVRLLLTMALFGRLANGVYFWPLPTQSQWIPNGPLWAGSTPAEAHYTESELPAGILQGPGGNGVLSGG